MMRVSCGWLAPVRRPPAGGWIEVILPHQFVRIREGVGSKIKLTSITGIKLSRRDAAITRETEHETNDGQPEWIQAEGRVAPAAGHHLHIELAAETSFTLPS